MIGSGSTLQVSDNSGAKLVQCIQPSGKSYTIGDVITVAVKAAGRGKVAAGTVQKAVIVETKKVTCLWLFMQCFGCSVLYEQPLNWCSCLTQLISTSISVGAGHPHIS